MCDILWEEKKSQTVILKGRRGLWLKVDQDAGKDGIAGEARVGLAQDEAGVRGGGEGVR